MLIIEKKTAPEILGAVFNYQKKSLRNNRYLIIAIN